jgi:hypothetical protein
MSLTDSGVKPPGHDFLDHDQSIQRFVASIWICASSAWGRVNPIDDS